MKVLLVGGGGREHALAIRLAASPKVKKLFCAPGNIGTATLGENVPISIDDRAALADFASTRKIDMTVVGPEAPLCAGLVDRFESMGLAAFGPTAAAARIEGDKAFAKQLMRSCLVPTAEGRIFERYEDARTYIATRDTPQVVKAAGLAAGKGVTVCDDPAQALLVAEELMVDGSLGEAGRRIVVEEKLNGREVSVFAIVNGTTIYLMEPATDFKRLLDGDRGPNTGGMGAYSPAAIDDATMSLVVRDIIVPTVDGLRSEGAPYRGFLYVGLMLTAAGPKVLEFNCRLGDPEAQVLMARLQSDLAEVLYATLQGKLDQVELRWDRRPAVCVVMASGGYPGAVEKGKVIHGLAQAAAVPDVTIHHAATRKLDDFVVTDGGRVLGVTALGGTTAQAAARAYEAVQLIRFEGAQFRKDIPKAVR